MLLEQNPVKVLSPEQWTAAAARKTIIKPDYGTLEERLAKRQNLPLELDGDGERTDISAQVGIVMIIAATRLVLTHQIEKWYTKCGSKHPIQNGPWCDVEKAMYSAFNKIKAINPKVTTIMYLVRGLQRYPRIYPSLT